MNFKESSPSEFNAIYDAVEAVENLPASQAFEQIMYDFGSRRDTLYTSSDTITIPPHIYESTVLPELKELLIESHTAQLKNVTAKQTIYKDVNDITRQGASLSFSLNDRDFSFLLSDHSHLLVIVSSLNGPIELEVDSKMFCSLLASTVFSMQYTDTTSDMFIVPDPLLRRGSDDPEQESLIERMLLTLGDLQGRTTIKTESVFPTVDNYFLSAQLTSIEDPSVSGIQSILELAPLTIDQTVTQLSQNEAHLDDGKLTKRYAEKKDSYSQSTTVITPEDAEDWADVCLEFHETIQPLMERYAAAENGGDLPIEEWL